MPPPGASATVTAVLVLLLKPGALAVTVKLPAWAGVCVAAVAPPIAVPFLFHWNVTFAVPS